MSSKTEAAKLKGRQAVEEGLKQMNALRENYGDIFLIVMIVMGFALAFGGIRLFQPTIGVLSGLFFWFFRQQFFFTADTRMLICCAVLLSVVVGFVAYYWVRYGIRMVGGFVGGFVGYYGFLWAKGFLVSFYVPSDFATSLLSIIAIAGVACVGVYYVDDVIETVMLIVCPLLGSFLAINGIGSYAGGLPDWQLLPGIIMKCNFQYMEKSHYYYIIALVILTGAAIYYQYITWFGKGHVYYTKAEYAEQKKEE